MLAPLAVAVEVRALDVGPRLLRAFRLSEGVSERGLRLERDLPFETGRPVVATLVLPDDEGGALELVGVVEDVRGITFTSVPADARQRLSRYVTERMLAP